MLPAIHAHRFVRIFVSKPRKLAVLGVILPLISVLACAPASQPAFDIESGAMPLTQLFAVADYRGQAAEYQFGTPSASSALIEGWGADEKRGSDQRPFVWGVGERSELVFFANRAVGCTLVLEGKAMTYSGAPKQVVEVTLNGVPIGEVTVGNRLNEHRLSIPADRMRVGENDLGFRYSYSRSPHEVDSDIPDKRPLAVQWFSVRFEGLGAIGQTRVDEDSHTLTIPLGSRVRFYFHTSDDGALILPALFSQTPHWPLKLHVEIEAEGGAMENRSYPLAETTEARIDLPSNELIRLTLSVIRDQEREHPWWHGFLSKGGSDEVSLPAAQLIGLQDTSPVRAGAEESERRPNVLIYLIDTLRADHLGVYGYDRPTSPRIDAFAEQATLFTHARAQTSWTRTAVVSLFTGLNPQTHRVNGRLDALPDSVDTLAERLLSAGYQTGAIITNGNIEQRFGTAQGFEGYHRLPERGRRPSIHELADRLNEEAFRWLSDVRDQERPFFLYLHATDPHAPYTPPEPFKSRFAPDVDPKIGLIQFVRSIFQGDIEAPPGFRDDVVDLYDAEIAFNDHHFGRLLDRLKALDLYEDLFIVLISDHGEEFLDHGSWEHGKTLYAEQLNVPLVIKLPRGEGAGVQVSALARQIDIMPTLLDYLDLPQPDVFDGRSLLPAIRGAEPDTVSPVSYSLVSLDKREIESAIGRGFKLIENRRHEVTHELYDQEEDPNEQQNLNLESPFERDYLKQMLRLIRWVQRQRSTAAPDQAEVTGELEERLRALGYLN